MHNPFPHFLRYTLLASLAVSPLALAQLSPHATNEEPSDQVRLAPEDLVKVDPETGEIYIHRATDADLELLDAINQSDEGLVVQEMPDGSQMIDLQGRFQVFSVATVNEDGEVQHICTTYPGKGLHSVSEHHPTKRAEQ